MQKMQCMGKNHTHFGQEPHFSRPARFRVSAAENVREFELQSGDALAFDPSSAAGIAHRSVRDRRGRDLSGWARRAVRGAAAI